MRGGTCREGAQVSRGRIPGAANVDRWSPRSSSRASPCGRDARTILRVPGSLEPSSRRPTSPREISNDAAPSDFDALLEAILSEIRAGARDVVLGGQGMEHPSSAAAAFVRLFLGYRKDLGISIRLDPPQEPPATPEDR